MRIGLGSTASNRNQTPTTINTNPLHRRTAVPDIRTGRNASELTEDTTTDAVMSRAMNTIAAVAKPATVWVAPTMRVWAARPASSGPVHPNPASR